MMLHRCAADEANQHGIIAMRVMARAKHIIVNFVVTSRCYRRNISRHEIEPSAPAQIHRL